MHLLALLVMVSEARTVPPFHAISIETTADVDVTIGAETKVAVSGPGARVGALETVVEHGSLRIRGPKAAKGAKGTALAVKVTITMPALDAIAVEGVSNVHVARLSAKQLALAVDGAATLDVAGAADSLALAISGAAQLQLAGLQTHATALEVSGLASGPLRADRALAV
jgi:hypothetical protein